MDEEDRRVERGDEKGQSGWMSVVNVGVVEEKL